MESLFVKVIDYNLPHPLDELKFKEYYYMMKNGDEEARIKLINHSLRLVMNIVLNKYRQTRYGCNELFQVGCIGLIKAVDTFDIRRGKFSSYAYICIQNEINQLLNKDSKTKNDISLDTCIYDDVLLSDTLVSEEDITLNYENVELYKRIKEIYLSLPQYDRNVMKLYFNKQLRQKQIAEIYNVHQGDISRLLRKNFTLISDILRQEGYVEGKLVRKNKKHKN